MFRTACLIMILSLIACPLQAGEPRAGQRVTLSITLRIPPRTEQLIDDCVDRWRRSVETREMTCRSNGHVMNVEKVRQGTSIRVVPI